jgi:hypothetical protein
MFYQTTRLFTFPFLPTVFVHFFLQLGGTRHLKGRRQVADKVLTSCFGKVAMQVAIEGCNQDFCFFFAPHQI